MKKIMVLAALAAALAIPAFAEGAQEEPARGFGMWDDAEELQLTGTVAFDEDGFPTLDTGSETYGLMVPRPARYGIDIEEGEEISVVGFVAPAPRWESADEATEFLHVISAIIDGEEYDLDEFAGGRNGGRMAHGSMMGGRGGSMMGGRGGARGNDWGGQGRW